MRVRIEPTTKVFQPVEVILTLETQAELEAWGTLLNYAPALDAVDQISGKGGPWRQIHERFEALGVEIHKHIHVFTNYCRR